MEISLENLYVGLKGSRDTLYNLGSYLTKMLLSYTCSAGLQEGVSCIRTKLPSQSFKTGNAETLLNKR